MIKLTKRFSLRSNCQMPNCPNCPMFISQSWSSNFLSVFLAPERYCPQLRVSPRDPPTLPTSPSNWRLLELYCNFTLKKLKYLVLCVCICTYIMCMNIYIYHCFYQFLYLFIYQVICLSIYVSI